MYCYNGRDRKIISVRVDPKKYDKIIKYIQEDNKNKWGGMLSFGYLVDKMMTEFIKDNNL